MKACSKCHRLLPLDGFYKNKYVKDGATSQCKECLKAKNYAYAKTEGCKDKSRKWAKRYRESAKGKETRAKWFKKGGNAVRVRMLSDKIQIRFRKTAKYFEYIHSVHHKNLRAIIGHKRRDTTRSITATLTAIEWVEIKKKYKQRCVYCGDKKPLTMDHIIPMSKGGHHAKNNIVPACRSCNSKKGNRSMLLQLLAEVEVK